MYLISTENAIYQDRVRTTSDSETQQTNYHDNEKTVVWVSIEKIVNHECVRYRLHVFCGERYAEIAHLLS